MESRKSRNMSVTHTEDKEEGIFEKQSLKAGSDRHGIR